MTEKQLNLIRQEYHLPDDATCKNCNRNPCYYRNELDPSYVVCSYWLVDAKTILETKE